MVGIGVLRAAVGVAIAFAVATSCCWVRGARAEQITLADAVTPTVAEAPRPAQHFATPDHDALRKASRHQVATVWCRAGRFEIPAARFDSTGVSSASSATYRRPRVAIIQSLDAMRFEPPPKPIAWATIDSIAVTNHRSVLMSPGFVLAALTFAIGTPVALVALVGSATHTRGSSQATALSIAVPLAAAALMTATLMSHHESYRVVYRAR